jgi:hypothetical protein
MVKARVPSACERLDWTESTDLAAPGRAWCRHPASHTGIDSQRTISRAPIALTRREGASGRIAGWE